MMNVLPIKANPQPQSHMKGIENSMKRIAALLVLLCTMTFLSAAYAGTPKYRTGTHARSYSTARQPSASRPYYGGGKHTTSHGGQYPGETNSHHRDGHYSNWQTGNRYGIHKPR
jgi:hypothetical protein